MYENEDNTTLQEYTIKGVIGSGSFSIVRSGINKKTKEKVAIKILDKSKIMNQKDYMKIVREINMLKSLNHPNVIKIHKACQNSNYIYIIMELCENGELFYYIIRKVYLSEEEAAFFYYQLINGLEHIHQNNIIHRDLKPENLLLSLNNTLKIIDFGLSNYFRNNLLTTPCGSACYASPEMISGQKYNGFMSDIWSTGIILYTMVCGQLPFDDKSDEIIFKKILACKIVFHKYVGELSKDLIKKILVTNPTKRITLAQIKKHEFYLKGKEVFYKKHPELIENNTVCENKNCIKMSLDSSKKDDKGYNGGILNKIKTIELVINAEQHLPYNCNTMPTSKKKYNFIKNISKEESKEVKNMRNSVLGPIGDEINISETNDSKRKLKDNEKPNKVRNISKTPKPMKGKDKIREDIQKFKDLNLKKINEKIEKSKNNKKNQNKTIILNKYDNDINATPQIKKTKPNVIISSQYYLTENANTVIESRRNIIKKKQMTKNLNMNNSNENRKEKSDSIVLHKKKLNLKSLTNFPKKFFSSKCDTLSKIIQDVNNNTFTNSPQSQKSKGDNNTIININNNINNPKLYIYIENNSSVQNEPFQSSIYSNNNFLTENNQFSAENKNPINQEKRNLRMYKINSIMNENSYTNKFSNTYYPTNYKINVKSKYGKDTQRIDTNYINDPYTTFNKTMNSLENNSLKYYPIPLNSSNDGNYNINNLTSFQRYTSKNKKLRPNSCINSNVIYSSKPTSLYGLDEYNSYNLQKAIESTNTSNDFSNSYFQENYIITRPEKEENMAYNMENTL